MVNFQGEAVLKIVALPRRMYYIRKRQESRRGMYAIQLSGFET
jgi:hypothetical protein